MSVNFFDTKCQSKTKEKKFGLYDAEDKTPAKIKLDDEPSWNATVKNEEAKEVVFTAVDNCIEVLRDNGEMESRCDGIITYDEIIMFVELKNKREGWQTEGLDQAEATIKRLKSQDENAYAGFAKRKVVVANAKHEFPCFQKIHKDQREYFMRNYKARIQFEAVIIIK